MFCIVGKVYSKSKGDKSISIANEAGKCFFGNLFEIKLVTSISKTGIIIAAANIIVHAIVKLAMPVVFSNHSMNGPHTSSITTVWTTTIPIRAVARKDSSNRGFFMNHNSLVGGRGVILIASCWHVFMQFEQKLHDLFESIVLGYSNIEHPSTFPSPLKHVGVLQALHFSFSARSSSAELME